MSLSENLELQGWVVTYSITAMENFVAKVKMIPKIQMPCSESLLTAVNN